MCLSGRRDTFSATELTKIMHYNREGVCILGGGGGGTKNKSWRAQYSHPEPTMSISKKHKFQLSSLIFIVVLLTVRERGAGVDLAVSVQPLLHHLGDQGVVTVAGALLHCDEEASIRHAAVQPLPQQLLLLLLVPHLLESKPHWNT